MIITKQEFANRIINGCNEVKAHEAELTEIDSHFGDADHGLTMVKISNAIIDAVNSSEGSIKNMLEDIADAIMDLSGGSSVPLWNSYFDGMQQAAINSDEMNLQELKDTFTNGYKEFADISTAKIGDKTMMDALILASTGLLKAQSVDELFEIAATEAAFGAEATKNYTAKFGRAKSYGEKTLGTPDAGALSMSYFFKGMAEK
ncbi:MAG: DAK2 domain-containing protein [Bacillota bacterium]|jgi:dihydroxyacetone kinase-like protein|nr:DAK2 domain-containing protein [Bacillota bacterium]NLL26948.1 DAK2 domain-containing protein [Erysipelotrichia bacterium]